MSVDGPMQAPEESPGEREHLPGTPAEGPSSRNTDAIETAPREVVPQAVHPLVVQRKFDREVDQFMNQSAHMRARGVLVLEVAAPTITLAFAATKLHPPGIVTAVRLDYSDYDLRPPSVQFVDPFTSERVPAEQLMTRMTRLVEQPMPMPMPGMPDGVAQPVMMVPQELIQVHEGGWPFLCVPGVLEYHDHPGHSGDPWELHRTTGAGSLVRLVEMIYKYAAEPVADWGVQLLPRVVFAVPQAPA